MNTLHNSATVAMYGRVYARILQKASSYRLTVYSTAPLQVSNQTSLFFTLVTSCKHLNCSLFPYSPFQAAYHCYFSSRSASGSHHRCSSGEESGFRSQSGRHFSARQDLDFQQSHVQINSLLRSNEQVSDSTERSKTLGF